MGQGEGFRGQPAGPLRPELPCAPARQTGGGKGMPGGGNGLGRGPRAGPRWLPSQWELSEAGGGVGADRPHALGGPVSATLSPHPPCLLRPRAMPLARQDRALSQGASNSKEHGCQVGGLSREWAPAQSGARGRAAALEEAPLYLQPWPPTLLPWSGLGGLLLGETSNHIMRQGPAPRYVHAFVLTHSVPTLGETEAQAHHS